MWHSWGDDTQVEEEETDEKMAKTLREYVYNDLTTTVKPKPTKEDLEAQKEQERKKIHSMDLHDTLTLDSLTIVRVPGGWLYIYSDMQPTFVPLSNEFRSLDKVVDDLLKD